MGIISYFCPYNTHICILHILQAHIQPASRLQLYSFLMLTNIIGCSNMSDFFYIGLYMGSIMSVLRIFILSS